MFFSFQYKATKGLVILVKDRYGICRALARKIIVVYTPVALKPKNAAIISASKVATIKAPNVFK